MIFGGGLRYRAWTRSSHGGAMMRSWTCVIPLAFVLTGCPGDDSASNEAGGSGSADTSGGECTPETDIEAADESSCAPESTDYQPLTNAAGDGWPACVTDDGDYHMIADLPSSIARVQAFEDVMSQLGVDLSPDGFTTARATYSVDEGLESRVVRREDLHYDPIPESDWDPGVDADKQCSVEANVERYPERCAGPARIGPIVNDAFAAGQTGEGVPEVHAARIEAALLWFMHLSVYKEANTCLIKDQDCDSSWAYYTGGGNRAGGIGLSEEIRGLTDMGHNRIWDGFSAVRCWRELYPIADYPTLDDVPAEGQTMLDMAYAQLDLALWYGWSRLVRDRIVRQSGACDLDFEANLAFLKIAGPVLSEQAERMDPAAAAPLAELWAADAPTAEQLEAAVSAIDAMFECP